MKAVRSFGAGDVRLVTVPDPVPTEGQVLIQITATGICGSDKWMWRHPEPVTQIIGHEVAGRVIALGPGVKHLRVGQRVAVNNVGGCGHCPACRAGDFILCPQWDGSLDINGGYAERVSAWERNCLPVPDELDDEAACLIFDNFGTPYGALERGEVHHGDDVLITGLGPIGMAAVILAKLRGAYVVAADPLPFRRDFALRLGADAALPPDEQLPAAVRELTSGLGVRVALECSGKGPAYPLAFASLRVGGTLVSVGEGAQIVLHPSDQIIRRTLRIQGSWYSGMQQGRQVMELMRSRQIDPHVLVTHRGSLEELPAIYRTVCEVEQGVMKAVIFPAK